MNVKINLIIQNHIYFCNISLRKSVMNRESGQWGRCKMNTCIWLGIPAGKLLNTWSCDHPVLQKYRPEWVNQDRGTLLNASEKTEFHFSSDCWSETAKIRNIFFQIIGIRFLGEITNTLFVFFSFHTLNRKKIWCMQTHKEMFGQVQLQCEHGLRYFH